MHSHSSIEQCFTNKVALVTGGDSGIGRAAGMAIAVVADVSVAAEAEAMVKHTLSAFGSLDIVFNNAGTESAFAPITELTENDFDHVVGINLKGVWLRTNYAALAMTSHGEQGGVIVNTASLLAMTRALAVELGPQGIRINSILPGIIATPMFERLGGNDALAYTFAAATPLRRVGQAADVGGVAVCLSSDEARFVKGQNLLTSNGMCYQRVDEADIILSGHTCM